MKKAIEMRSQQSDQRLDDIYIDPDSSIETGPPPRDNLGISRKINVPDILAKVKKRRN